MSAFLNHSIKLERHNCLNIVTYVVRKCTDLKYVDNSLSRRQRLYASKRSLSVILLCLLYKKNMPSLAILLCYFIVHRMFVWILIYDAQFIKRWLISVVRQQLNGNMINFKYMIVSLYYTMFTFHYMTVNFHDMMVNSYMVINFRNFRIRWIFTMSSCLIVRCSLTICGGYF